MKRELKNLFYSVVPKSSYLKFSKGNINLILSAPHGGSIRPMSLPKRKYGNLNKDSYTLELTENLLSFYRYNRPYFVYSEIHRSRVDLNRNLGEAAQNNSKVIKIWNDWNDLLNEYTGDVISEFKYGLYIDLHGQSHDKKFHLGYNLPVKTIKKVKDGNIKSASSSLSSLDHSLRDMMFGRDSFYSSLTAVGFKVQEPISDDDYYNGGRNTQVYSGYGIGGLQIECPIYYLKNNLEEVALILYSSIEKFRDRYC